MRTTATLSLLLTSQRLPLLFAVNENDPSIGRTILLECKLLSLCLSRIDYSLPQLISKTYDEFKTYSDKLLKILVKFLLHLLFIFPFSDKNYQAAIQAEITAVIADLSLSTTSRLQHRFMLELQGNLFRYSGVKIQSLLHSCECVSAAIHGEHVASAAAPTILMCMYAKSIILLGRQSSDDSMGEEVEWNLNFNTFCEQLIDFAFRVDADLANRLPNAAVAKFKGSNTFLNRKNNAKATKSSLKGTGKVCSDNQDYVSLHSFHRYQLWCLLANCSSPYFAERGLLSSMGTDLHCVFLSSAIKALQEVENDFFIPSGTPSLQIPASAETIICTTAKQLFYALDSQGRLSDQVQ